MSGREVRRFVSDLLRGRRPIRFRVGEDEANELRAAILLRAARPGADKPREEFVTELHRRLAAAQAEGGPPAVASLTRRRLVRTAGVAASAAAVGAGVDHVLSSSADQSGGQQTLVPNSGQWRTVAASTDLPEGAVAHFDLGSVIGFVTRSGGRVAALSGICTHLGCRLAFNAPARRLDCPCHLTEFSLAGQTLTHQLDPPPPPLPHLPVREAGGAIQVFAPPPTA